MSSQADQNVAKATNEFLESTFYQSLFKPFLDAQREAIVEAVMRNVAQGARKEQYAVLTGRLQIIRDIETEIETWAKRHIEKNKK